MTYSNRKSVLFAACLAVLLGLGLVGCGEDSSTAPPPPAPPPFVPQTVNVTLGENGGTVALQTTQAGGYTRGGEAFASGSTVVGENDKTYRITVSGTQGTAEFVPADALPLALGSSRDLFVVTEQEDGSYIGKSATGELTFSSGDVVEASTGQMYRVTLVDGAWAAVYEPPAASEVTLGASGQRVDLVMTEDGGWTLNGSLVMSGSIVTAGTGAQYRLTYADGEWTATYATPDPTRLPLGTSGEVAELVRLENGTFEIGGSAVTSGSTITANNGNQYRLRLQNGEWSASFVPNAPEQVSLGSSGLQIVVVRQEDGTYRHGNNSVQNGSVVTAANGSLYRLNLVGSAWQATFVPPQAIPVLLGTTGELANLVQREDGGFEVNGQLVGPDTTVSSSSGNMYRIMRSNGTWVALFVAPQPVAVPLGQSGQTVMVTRREDGTWLGDGSPILSGSTVMGPGGTRFQLVFQGSQWTAVWLATPPEALVLGSSGDAVVITQVEDGTYRANSDPIATGSTIQARNGATYRLTMANGRWVATFVTGDPISVVLGTSGTTAMLLGTEQGSLTWNGQTVTSGGTIRAPNGSDYRLTEANGAWTAAYVAPPPANVALGTTGESIALTRREDGNYVLPTGMVISSGSTVRSGNGGQYRLTMASGAWVAEYQPTSQSLTLGASGGVVTVIREENGEYWIGREQISDGEIFIAENGNQFRVNFVNGQWRAAFVPSVVRVPAGDSNFIVTLQRLEDGSFLYSGDEYNVGDSIVYRGSRYTINLTNGVLSLDVESGRFQVPLGSTGDFFTLVRTGDGTFTREDGRPFRSGTSIVQNGFIWRLTLSDGGEWTAQILRPVDPNNPTDPNPVDPTNPTDPTNPVDPVTPTGNDKRGVYVPSDAMFGLKNEGASTVGNEGSILVVGATGNQVEYSVNDLVGRGTVTIRQTFAERAQKQLRDIIQTIEAYSRLYELEAIDPDDHIGGTDGQWDEAKAVLNAIAAGMGTRLNDEPWSGTLDFAEVDDVIAELEEVISELGSAGEIDAHYSPTDTDIDGDDIVTAAISQIRFGSSGNTRFAVYSIRPADQNVTSTGWTHGAFAYSPLDQPGSADLPQRGSATYKGSTVAVATSGDSVGELYTGAIELTVQFSQRRVDGLVTGLVDSNNSGWEHDSNPTEAIRLPQATLQSRGDFTAGASGTGHVRYPPAYGGEAPETASSLDGQILSDGREAMGTWKLGTILEGAFGTSRTSTTAPARPTVSDGGDNSKTGLGSSASDVGTSATLVEDGDLTLGGITIDASRIYSSRSHSVSENTFVSEARRILSTQRSVLNLEKREASPDPSVAWSAVEAAISTILSAFTWPAIPGSDLDGINDGINLIDDARAALGSTSRFLQELGTDDDDIFDGALQGSATPPSEISDLFAARPSVFRAESDRTNYTRFGAWRNITQETADADKATATGVYAYSPLEATNLTETATFGFRAVYEGDTVAVRAGDGAFFDGAVQIVIGWDPDGTNQVTGVIQDLRSSSDNSFWQYGGQDVGYILFSGATVPSSGLIEFSGASTIKVRYRDVHLGESTITTGAMGGKFVGNGPEGPVGVIGDWSILSGNDALAGAYGADLLP